MPFALLGLLKNPWILLVIACVIGAGGTGWYRMEWEGEKAARVADALAAQQAADAKLAEAKINSDKALAEQHAQDTSRDNTVITYVDRVIHAPAPPVSCPPSPASRDASAGVRAALQNPTGPAKP